MTPLLLVKTANGFMAMPFRGELPQNVHSSEIEVATEMVGGYTYIPSGLLKIRRRALQSAACRTSIQR